MDEKSKSINIRDLVLNTRRPIVFKNLRIPWKCLQISKEEWCKLLQKELQCEENGIRFETCTRKNGEDAQWEKYRIEKTIKIEEFLKEQSDFFNNNWACLSYRNILELPEVLRNDIKFSCFGFPEINEDSTVFWLNSSGCNTPCHYDTYGCNIVVQVYGIKSWLFFEPDAPLNPTRLPYEESSVYCMENFYSPKNLDIFKEIKFMAYRCLLEAGDVLVIPKGWWHFVESLETSLSFNHWIPLISDVDSQIKECIVKYLIEKSVTMEDEISILEFINPNQVSQLIDESEMLGILKDLCKKKLQYSENHLDCEKSKKNKDSSLPYQYLSEEQVSKLMEDQNIAAVNKISEVEFMALMERNSKRFDKLLNRKQLESSTQTQFKRIFVNSLCNPKIVDGIVNLLLKQFHTITKD